MIKLTKKEIRELEEFYFQRALLNPNERFSFLREIKKLRNIKKQELKK